MKFDPLSVDLYEIWMAMTYFEISMKGRAAFEFFARNPLKHRSFLLSAGLETLLDYLENFQIDESHLQQLQNLGLDSKRLQSLKNLKFTGDVYAVPEGIPMFGDEPLLRIEAPIAEAQLIETAVINILQFQTLIASKAIRSVMAAKGKDVIDFGLRRAHGTEAGLFAARACAISGFAGTSNVSAGVQFGIPLSGTMAHSFIQAHANEMEAFRNFALHNPKNMIFLLDTYDTLSAAEKVCELAPQIQFQTGHPIQAVRLDSGDLATLSRQVRQIFDRKGLNSIKIIASGNLDEFKIQQLEQARAPIDVYAVGTQVDISADQPFLDCAYKLVEYEGQPRMKLSSGKRLLAGRKQIFRFRDSQGQLSHDILANADESFHGEPLMKLVFQNGRRIQQPSSLNEIRKRVENEISRLPEYLRTLETAPFPVVQYSDRLLELSRQVEEKLMPSPTSPASDSAHL